MVDGVTTRGPDDELVVEARGGVRVVTLNRPDALNAANDTLHAELAGIWAELDSDPDVRVVVVTGSGRAFCAGGDLDLLNGMITDTALRDAIMAEAAEIVRSMTSVRVPI